MGLFVRFFFYFFRKYYDTSKETKKEQLTRCLEQLEPEEKMLVEELFLKGKTMRTISAELGMPLSTAQYRKEKVLSKLKNLLEGSLEENKAA